MICEHFAREGSHIMINYWSSGLRAREVAAAVDQHGVAAATIMGVSRTPQMPPRVVLAVRG